MTDREMVCVERVLIARGVSFVSCCMRACVFITFKGIFRRLEEWSCWRRCLFPDLLVA